MMHKRIYVYDGLLNLIWFYCKIFIKIWYFHTITLKKVIYAVSVKNMSYSIFIFIRNDICADIPVSPVFQHLSNDQLSSFKFPFKITCTVFIINSCNENLI